MYSKNTRILGEYMEEINISEDVNLIKRLLEILSIFLL